MVDGTQDLPALGQKMVESEWKGRGGQKLTPVSNHDLDQIVKRLIHQRPNTTVSDLETRIAGSKKNLSGSLSRLTKTEPHLHRKRVQTGRTNTYGRAVSEFAYWFDESVDNPHLGAARLNKLAVPLPPEPEPAEETGLTLGEAIALDEFAKAVQVVNKFKADYGVELELAINPQDGRLQARIVQTFE